MKTKLKTNLTFAKFVALDIEYYNFFEVTNRETGETGVRYELCTPLTDKQRATLERYPNVIISEGQHRYAPEIKRESVVIMGDRI